LNELFGSALNKTKERNVSTQIARFASYFPLYEHLKELSGSTLNKTKEREVSTQIAKFTS
jgi:hypothetical protein